MRIKNNHHIFYRWNSIPGRHFYGARWNHEPILTIFKCQINLINLWTFSASFFRLGPIVFSTYKQTVPEYILLLFYKTKCHPNGNTTYYINSLSCIFPTIIFTIDWAERQPARDPEINMNLFNGQPHHVCCKMWADMEIN